MRELTPYEKEKWFDEYKRFKMESSDGAPWFLGYGDELGEAFDGALYCTDKESYGLSEEFVLAAQIEVLDMYYYQIHYYTGEYGGYETPETLGLPPVDDFIAKAKELGCEDLRPWVEFSDNNRRLWDWAMDWRGEQWQRIESLLDGASLIASERLRQIEVEDWSSDHDDEHNDGDLSRAAACYALEEVDRDGFLDLDDVWPWAAKWWKPTPEDRVRELVKAGALIAAEIDRLQRNPGA